MTARSRGRFRLPATLAAIAAICTLLVAATYRVTADRIDANEQAWLERSLEPALSGVFFDGSVTEYKLELDPPLILSNTRWLCVVRVADRKPEGDEALEGADRFRRLVVARNIL